MRCVVADGDEGGEEEEEEAKDCVCTRVFITSSGKMDAQVITPAIPPASNTFAAAIFWDSSASALLEGLRMRLQIS